MQEGIVEISVSGFFMKDVCYILEKDGKREVVLRVCEHEKEGSFKPDSLVEKRCVDFKALLCGRNGVL